MQLIDYVMFSTQSNFEWQQKIYYFGRLFEGYFYFLSNLATSSSRPIYQNQLKHYRN